MFGSRNKTILCGDQSRHCDVGTNGLQQKSDVTYYVLNSHDTDEKFRWKLYGSNLPLWHHLLTITTTDRPSLTGSEFLALTGFYRILPGAPYRSLII